VSFHPYELVPLRPVSQQLPPARLETMTMMPLKKIGQKMLNPLDQPVESSQLLGLINISRIFNKLAFFS
jgi:hypothetical protein